MTSWVYIFSKFTPEALLFEALLIFLLCCGYTAFWVLRKRRYGAIRSAIPSGPVKSYLNELIYNAEQLRLQLFGLLASSDTSASKLYRMVDMTSGPNASDSELSKKLASLESKNAEQLKTIENLTSEKTRLEHELANAKVPKESSTKAAAPTTANTEDANTIVKLNQKIEDLESKLAEYNVIEDDLANLKRLQQENASLKAALAEQGSTPKPATPAATSDRFEGLAATVEDSLQSPPETSSVPSSETKTGPTQTVQGQPDQTSPTTQAAAPTSGGSAEASNPPAPTKSENEKSEADLVSEFERMLKG
jgi:uncharacterized coiled-coil protein SlyX